MPYGSQSEEKSETAEVPQAAVASAADDDSEEKPTVAAEEEETTQHLPTPVGMWKKTGFNSLQQRSGQRA